MRQNRNGNHSRSGMALLYAAFGAFVAAGMVSVLLTLSMSSSRMAAVSEGQTQASYAAEGAVEAAKKSVQTAIANFAPVPTAGAVTIEGNQVGYTITPTGFAAVTTDGSGLQRTMTGYQISATANVDGHQATANRLVNVSSVPLFQFAVFYNNDLEINPGPDMTLGGRVHSNGNMHLGSGSTLTVDSNYLRAVGDIYRHRKDDPNSSQGRVKIREWVNDPFDSSEPVAFRNMHNKGQLDALGVPNVSGYDSNFTSDYDGDGDGDYYGPNDFLGWDLGALEYWDEPTGYTNGTGHTVLTSDHGMSEAVTPSVGSVAMFDAVPGGTGGNFVWDGSQQKYVPASVPGTGTHDKGYYHASADLSIITHDDGSIEAYDSAGNSVSLPAGAVTVKSMFDARQGGDVQITEIDMSVLNGSPSFPANGLLYTGSYGAGSGVDAHGVRLVNGSELANALSVVTENSLYVQGDYNTVNKKPASVIADAVNLLSNSWDDSKSSGNLPRATETTYNMAMITGNQDTTVGGYNGGLENLPRFHEGWSGVDCNISGSFVNTWLSNHATGAWRYGGDRYKAPNRNWNYDPMFNNVANLPPFTPMAVSAIDVATF